MNISSYDPCISNKTTWCYLSLLLAETTFWTKQTMKTFSIHHSWNLSKGGYDCSSEMQCLVSFFLTGIYIKKQTNRRKNEFHSKENPYTQTAQPPIFSYRNINSVRHQYNCWEAITFILFESVLWNESLNTDGQ